MALRLNMRAYKYAKQQIALGAVNPDDPYEPTQDQLEDLIADAGRNYLVRDNQDTGEEFVYPMGILDGDGELVVYLEAIRRVLAASTLDQTILDAAGDLMALGEADAEATAAAAAAADDGASAPDGGDVDNPKPPEHDDTLPSDQNPGGPSASKSKDASDDVIRDIRSRGRLERIARVRRTDIDVEARTVQLSFSSEHAVQRWFGWEILDHSPSSVNLDELRDGGAVLVNHNTNQHVGVVERAWIAAGKGHAVVRFGKSQAADDVFQDIIDGIRSKVSVGYELDDGPGAVVEAGMKGDTPIYRFMRWTPYEISIVPVPADPGVGVGRKDPNHEVDPMKINGLNPEALAFFERNAGADGAPGGGAPATPPPAAPPAAPTSSPPAIDPAKVSADASRAERERVVDIQAMASQLGPRLPEAAGMAAKAIADGTSVRDFGKALVERLGSGPVKPVADGVPTIGLTLDEIQDFSVVRAIRAMDPNATLAEKEAAKFEMECSRAAEQKMKRTAEGLLIPHDILLAQSIRSRRAAVAMRRDLEVQTSDAGGYLVGTELMSIIELLRNRMMVQRMGARVLTGLVGDLAIPKQTGGATAYWLGEGGAPTESQQYVGQVALRPRTVGAFTDYSRKIIKQSSIDIESFVREDLSRVLALAIDLAALTGTGAAEPLGIKNTTGVATVAIGTDGGQLTWPKIVQMESEVAYDNADVGSLGYLVNAKTRGALKAVEKASATAAFIWENNNTGDGSGMVNGYMARASNQLPSNLTKGSGTGLSMLVFGNWDDMVIGQWGALDILVDPYTASTTGAVRVTAHQDVDVAVRHPESFSIIVDHDHDA